MWAMMPLHWLKEGRGGEGQETWMPISGDIPNQLCAGRTARVCLLDGVRRIEVRYGTDKLRDLSVSGPDHR